VSGRQAQVERGAVGLRINAIAPLVVISNWYAKLFELADVIVDGLIAHADTTGHLTGGCAFWIGLEQNVYQLFDVTPPSPGAFQRSCGG